MTKYRRFDQRLNTWNSGDGDGAMSPVVERSHENSPLPSPTVDTGDNKYINGENSLDDSGLHLTKEYEDSSSNAFSQDASTYSLNDSGLDIPDAPDIKKLQTVIKQLKEENKDLEKTVTQMKEQIQHHIRYTARLQESYDDAVDLTVTLRQEIGELETRLQNNEVSKQLQTDTAQQVEEIKIQNEDINYLTKTIEDLEKDVKLWRVRSSLLDIDNDGYKQEIMDLNEQIYQLMRAGNEDKKRLDDFDASKVQPLFSDVIKALSPDTNMDETKESIPSPSIKTDVDNNVMKALSPNTNMEDVKENIKSSSIQRFPTKPTECGNGETTESYEFNSEKLSKAVDKKQNHDHDSIQAPSFADVMKALCPDFNMAEINPSASIKTAIDKNDKLKLGQQKLNSSKLQQSALNSSVASKSDTAAALEERHLQEQAKIQRCPTDPTECGYSKTVQSLSRLYGTSGDKTNSKKSTKTTNKSLCEHSITGKNLSKVTLQVSKPDCKFNTNFPPTKPLAPKTPRPHLGFPLLPTPPVLKQRPGTPLDSRKNRINRAMLPKLNFPANCVRKGPSPPVKDKELPKRPLWK